MNARLLFPRVPIALATLILASLVLLYAGACAGSSGDDPSGNGSGRSARPHTSSEGTSDATQRVIEDIFGVAEVEEVPLPDLPELAFRRQAEGLPRGGTWREYPLLHDFTGDGRADLVASNREEDGLNAWRAPGPGEEAWELRIEGLPRDMMYGDSAGADLDGDRDQDLVFVSHKTGLRVFLNDGDMSWTPGPAVPNPFLMLDVALGDVDGDGHVDAVGIGHFNGGIGVYLGDGKGGFARLDQSRNIIGGGRFGMEVELADMDQDGLDDIVACTDKGAAVFLTRRTPDGGELYWSEASEGLPAPVIGNALRGLIPADFTGDGALELAFCALADTGLPASKRDTAGLLRRNEDGSWSRIDRGLPRGEALRDIAAGDLDRDGRMDLVLASAGKAVVLYLGDGQGGFSPQGYFPETSQANQIELGDVNGDGWLDVAVQSSASKHDPAGGGIVLFLNGPEVWSEAGE